MDDRSNWYDVLFSIASGQLTQQQKDDLSALQASWVFLNARLGRWYINILGPKAQLLAIQNYLIAAGRSPITIAVFQLSDDGLSMDLVGQPNKAEYLNVAPDVVTATYSALGVLISAIPSRPGAFVDVHRFAGWPAKNVP